MASHAIGRRIPARPVIMTVIMTIIGAALLAATRPAGAGDLKPLITVEGITEYRLDNGLRVLLFPDASKPTVTVNVTYMVGSRHEGRGEKGMAHLLEHMVFKGTETHDNIWGALQDHGARFNGTTWVDRTNYYETLPATEENLRFAVAMEADRMVNSRVSAEDLASEMTVVRNEFEMGENNPVSILMERLVSAAFIWHNYGDSTIGNRSDIERVPAESLRRFYQRYYQPDNALLVIAGKFDADLALDLVQEHFGAIPRPQRTLEATYTEEPVQDGSRFVTLRRVGSVQATGAVYHLCAASHEDYPAIEVLTQVLLDEPSGRVYQALVEGGLAASVFGFAFPTAEPGALVVMAEAGLDQDIEAAHARMIETIEGIAASGISEEEVQRARTKLLKDISLAMTDSGRIGIQLSESQALGDWRMFFVHRDRLKSVTADDVRRVAGHYLVESNRTSGIFIPEEDSVRAQIPRAPGVESIVEGYRGTETIALGEAFEATPEIIEQRTIRRTLAGGMKLAMLPKETRGDAVVASFVFHFGREQNLQGHTTALEMIPSMLMRGTQHRDYQALQDEIDRLKSRINLMGGAGELNASITTDREHLVASIQLLGEMLREPSFPPEQLEVLRREELSQLETGLTDPQALLFNTVMRSMSPFPPESVHYVPTMQEQIDRVKALSIEGLRDVYQRFYGASHVEVALVGDFDPAELTRVLETTFGSWPSPGPYERIARPYRPIEPLEEIIDTPDKQMAALAMGTVISMRDDDEDYPALAFANHIFGQSAKSRLLNRLRHQDGLSYGAGSMLQASSHDPVTGLVAFAICAPQNLQQATVAMDEEYQRWVRDGVSDQELTEGKTGYAQQFQTTLASDRFIAAELRKGLEIGRTFQFHSDLMESIDRLTLEEIADVLRDRFSSASIVRIQAGDMEKGSD